MSDNQPGAGGKGSAGYWGYSSDDSKDEQYERLYRLRIPKNRYKTTTHNPLTCGKCTNAARTIHLCKEAEQIGFSELPTVSEHVNNKLIERCAYCDGIIRESRTPGKPKKDNKAKN